MDHEPKPASAAETDPLWTPLTPGQLSALRRPPTAKEIARRRKALARIQQIQESMGPVDVDPGALLRQVRQEEDAKLDG